ncbi:ankyrin repeat domain-containing protein [Verrucomicrobiota bacterium]
MRQTIILFLLAMSLFAGCVADKPELSSNKEEAIAALNQGNYKEAYNQFLPLADNGDDNAMITIGLMFHQGNGFKQDYSKAMDWYIKAFKKENGDAYNNIGVMYRDGLGVKKNKKMAYTLFLVTHVCSLGTESTQYRANSSLRRIIPEMSKEDLVECFNYTLEYVKAYVTSKGTIEGIPDKYKPSKKRVAIKNKPWWVEGELDFLGKDGPDKNAPKKAENKAKFEMGSVSFSNHGLKDIFVDRILCDGKPFSVPVGCLGAGGGGKASAFMFPPFIPKKFTIEYEKDGKKLKDEVEGKWIEDLLEKAKPAKEVTLHFIYSDEEKFIVKVYFDRGENRNGYGGELWPDEKDPNFALYKELIENSYNGNTDKVRELIEKGAPCTWKNEPVSLTPLEWTARWNRIDAFNTIIKIMPKDYSVKRYANCIKLAAQDDNMEILAGLLKHPKCKEISEDKLQNLFYSTCNSAKKTETLELLLNCFDVGVDFRVRDYGHTLLFVAVQADNASLVEWLLNQGADVSKTLKNGSKAIDSARSEAVKKLFNK